MKDWCRLSRLLDSRSSRLEDNRLSRLDDRRLSWLEDSRLPWVVGFFLAGGSGGGPLRWETRGEADRGAGLAGSRS